MTDTEKAWLAGIIDGEGSIGFYRRVGDGKYICYSVRLTVKMSHAETIQRIKTLTVDGCLQVQNSRPDRYKPGYVWTVGARAAIRILKEIEPYCVTKREQVMAAILADAARKDHYSKHRGENVGEPVAELERHRAKFAVLNRRGPNKERAVSI